MNSDSEEIGDHCEIENELLRLGHIEYYKPGQILFNGKYIHVQDHRKKKFNDGQDMGDAPVKKSN